MIEKTATTIAAMTQFVAGLTQDCRLYLQQQVREPPGNQTSGVTSVGASFCVGHGK